mgnify:CR=1 FL=1
MQGPEFLGDLRAGIKEVTTFFFPYEFFKKRLSVTERVRLQQMEFYQERFDGIINVIAQRDNIPVEKLRRF